MIRTISLLHLRRIGRHPLRSAIAVVALASGVALTVTVGVVQTSSSRSFDEYARSLAGPAPLRVVGPVERGGLPEQSVARVQSVAGVKAAVPLIQAVTLADGAKRRDIPIVAIGYDCTVRALVGNFACDQSAILAATTYRAPLLSPSLAKTLGPDGVVRTNDGPKPVRGGFPVKDLEKVNNGRVVAFPIHVAQALFTRPHSLDVIYVLPKDGTDVTDLERRLEEAVGTHNTVLTADEPIPQLTFFTQLYVALALVGLGTLATGAVLAHNALALSLEDRRRDLAVAAAIGGKPRTIVGGTLIEGMTLGAVGGLVGAAAGIGIAYPVLQSFQFLTERFAGLTMRVHLTPTPFVTGVVLGIVLGLVAAIRPARRASRLDVVAELQSRGGDESRAAPSLFRPLLVLALGLVGIGVTVLAAKDGALRPWQPIVAQLAALVSAFAFSSAIGQFAPLALSIGARLARGRRAATHMAWRNLVGEGWRSASMVLAAGGAIAAGFIIANLGRIVLGGLADSSTDYVRGSVAVTTTSLNNSASIEAKPSPAVIRGLRAVPGVARVRRSLYAGIASPSGVFSAEGEPRPPRFEVLRGRSDAAAFARGEVLIGPALARREGITPGETIRIPSRTGFVDVRVQGIVANGDFTGLEVSMPTDLFERLWGPQPPVALTVDPTAGTDTSELARRIEAAGLDPHLNALAEHEFISTSKEENGRFFAPFWALQRALVVIAFAAVLSNLMLVALRRKRELGLVAAVGMSPEQLGRMVVTEAFAIGVVAFLLAGIFSLGGTEAMRHALNIMIPYPMPFRLDVAAPFVYGGITMVVVLLAASWPAWRTSRLNVVDALRYE